MKMTRGQRLRAAREKFFDSAAAFAKAMDVPTSTYNSHERAGAPGARDYTPEIAEKYARRLQVRPEWLLTGRGPEAADPELEQTPRMMTRIVGYVGAGSTAHFYAVAQGDLDEVQAPEGATAQTVAVEIRGESLGRLFDRWLVFYDDVRSPVTEDLFGKLCVVGLSDDRVLIKKIVPERNGLFRLLSEREPPIDGVSILWAAKVKNMVPR